MDDFSRTILAARFSDSDSTCNNILVLGEAIEKYGIFPLLHKDKILCELPQIIKDKDHGRDVMFFEPRPRVPF
jgi:hypothetical protein